MARCSRLPASSGRPAAIRPAATHVAARPPRPQRQHPASPGRAACPLPSCLTGHAARASSAVASRRPPNPCSRRRRLAPIPPRRANQKLLCHSPQPTRAARSRATVGNPHRGTPRLSYSSPLPQVGVLLDPSGHQPQTTKRAAGPITQPAPSRGARGRPACMGADLHNCDSGYATLAVSRRRGAVDCDRPRQSGRCGTR